MENHLERPRLGWVWRGLLAAASITVMVLASHVASGWSLERGSAMARHRGAGARRIDRPPAPELAAAWRVERGTNAIRRRQVEPGTQGERRARPAGRVRTGPRLFALQTFVGEATVYAESFDGELTACGSPLDMNGLTAAHPTLPCGTQVLVENASGSGRALVTITDRGPFAEGRILDLTGAAWRRVTNEPPGVVVVRATVLAERG